mmetsp:Transcript_1003/g.2470  ORF Transcript_1003/g.2470 Transcript_1003/m.2470 type:complete len:141 (+) Transcript_1003:1563-1985(+)
MAGKSTNQPRCSDCSARCAPLFRRTLENFVWGTQSTSPTFTVGGGFQVQFVWAVRGAECFGYIHLVQGVRCTIEATFQLIATEPLSTIETKTMNLILPKGDNWSWGHAFAANQMTMAHKVAMGGSLRIDVCIQISGYMSV